MSLIVFFQASDHTQEQYDQVIKGLEARGMAEPDGRLYHVSWSSPEGWNVLDVWESEEKLGKFAEVMQTIVPEAGATPMQPQVFPAYNIIKG